MADTNTDEKPKSPVIDKDSIVSGWDNIEARAHDVFLKMKNDRDTVAGLFVNQDPVHYVEDGKRQFRFAFYNAETRTIQIASGGVKWAQNVLELRKDIGKTQLARTLVQITRRGKKGDTATIYLFDKKGDAPEAMLAAAAKAPAPELMPEMDIPF